MFADFIECENLLNFNDSLNSVSRTGTIMSILSLIILVGISESCEALEQSRFFSFFSFSIAWISWKRKLTFSFSLFVFICLILGWFLYYSVALNTGSSMPLVLIVGSSYWGIFKLIITLAEELLKDSDIYSFSDIISSSSTRIVLSWSIFHL